MYPRIMWSKKDLQSKNELRLNRIAIKTSSVLLLQIQERPGTKSQYSTFLQNIHKRTINIRNHICLIQNVLLWYRTVYFNSEETLNGLHSVYNYILISKRKQQQQQKMHTHTHTQTLWLLNTKQLLENA